MFATSFKYKKLFLINLNKSRYKKEGLMTATLCYYFLKKKKCNKHQKKRNYSLLFDNIKSLLSNNFSYYKSARLNALITL